MHPYLLSGSLSYDTILIHEGHFHSRILPEEIARLSVAFGVDEVHEGFGGTAGNIAYNAALLGNMPLMIASVGELDGEAYKTRLGEAGFSLAGIQTVENERCSHAWILTDSLNNQITGFHAGAIRHIPPLPAGDTPDLWHIAPDNKGTIVVRAREAMALGKQYILDPGQALPAFLEGTDRETLRELVKGCVGLFVNEYEALLIEEKFGLFLTELSIPFVVRTMGAKGSDLIVGGNVTSIPCATPDAVVDPTGCGDAYRAGFLYGLTKGWDLTSCALLGSTMGSFAIEHAGGQQHKPVQAQVLDRLGAVSKVQGLK